MNQEYSHLKEGGERGMGDDGERASSKGRVKRSGQVLSLMGLFTEQSKRKKIGQKDADTQDLLGVISQTTKTSQTSCQCYNRRRLRRTNGRRAKRRRLLSRGRMKNYNGKTLSKHEGGKKGDGSLMGAGSDWKNL